MNQTFAREVRSFMQMIRRLNYGQSEFIQSVEETVKALIPYIEEHPVYKKHKILERMVEAERIVIFRVPWIDDKGEVQVNRGYRVEMNSAIGPYKGGLRFHPTVNLSILKFLAFEQIFKNSLTTLPMGAGKGGSNFDPKGKSDNEIMRFCQSFMSELFRYIGPNTDVPAGDIGVGAKEIGYLFGQYKRLKDEFTGVLTGKGIEWGGSLIRPEATGYGCVYFTEEMLKTRKESINGKTITISGSGNVAQFACRKAWQFGGKVVSMSDSGGAVHDPDGFDEEKLAFMMDLKNNRKGRVKEYADKYGIEYLEGKRPWQIKCDIALPCATQNEIDKNDAETLIRNGCICVAEGANMPSDNEAIGVYQENKILFGPGKAANAGGVAVSGLEMAQNSLRTNWLREEVKQKLFEIMKNIHATCISYGKENDGFVNYVKGGTIGGFKKVADAIIAQGVV